MEYLIIDTETTTYSKGNPYSQQNKLCLVGIRDPEGNNLIYDVEYSSFGYAKVLERIQQKINDTKTLVLFNAKFDLAWLRRYGINFHHCRIFDCQLFHFINTGQLYPFPSLNQVAEYYNLEQKLDIIKEEYWDKEIDTIDIPLYILT